MFLDKVGSFAVAFRALSFSITEKCSSGKSSRMSTSSSKDTTMKNTNKKQKFSNESFLMNTNLLNKNTASSFFLLQFCVLSVLCVLSVVILVISRLIGLWRFQAIIPLKRRTVQHFLGEVSVERSIKLV